MSSYFTLRDDMDQLKAQMNILMSHLKQNEIITDEMVRRSVQTHMKSILPSRFRVNLGLFIVGAFMPIYLIVCYCLGMINSLPFVIATIALCLYSAAMMLLARYNDLRNVCKNGTLTELATQVARYRRRNTIASIATPLVVLAWAAVYFSENYKALLDEHNGLFIACGIILFVTVYVICGYRRVNRVAGDVLEEIENLKKDE